MKLSDHLSALIKKEKKEKAIEPEKTDNIIADAEIFDDDYKRLISEQLKPADWTETHITDVLSNKELAFYSKVSKIMSFPYPFMVLMSNVSKLAAGDHGNEKHIFKMSTVNARFGPVESGSTTFKIQKGKKVEIREDELDIPGESQPVKIKTGDESYVKIKDIPPYERYKIPEKYIEVRKKDTKELLKTVWPMWKWINPLETNDYVRLRRPEEEEYTLVPHDATEKDVEAGIIRPHYELNWQTGQISKIGERTKNSKNRIIDRGRGYLTAKHTDLGNGAIGWCVGPEERERLIYKNINYYNKYVYYEKSGLPLKEKREKQDALIKEFMQDSDMRTLTSQYLSAVQPSTIRDLVKEDKPQKSSFKGKNKDEEYKKALAAWEEREKTKVAGWEGLNPKERKRLGTFTKVHNMIIDEMVAAGKEIATIKTMLLATTGFSNYVFSKYLYDEETGFSTQLDKPFFNTSFLYKLLQAFDGTSYENNEAAGIVNNISQVQNHMVETLYNLFDGTIKKEDILQYNFVKNCNSLVGDYKNLVDLQPVFDAIRGKPPKQKLKEMAQTHETTELLRWLYRSTRLYILKYYDKYINYADFELPQGHHDAYSKRFNQFEKAPEKVEDIPYEIFNKIANALKKPMLDFNQEDITGGPDDTFRNNTAGFQYVFVEKPKSKESIYRTAFIPSKHTIEKRYKEGIAMLPINDAGIKGIWETWYLTYDVHGSKPTTLSEDGFDEIYALYKNILLHAQETAGNEVSKGELELLKDNPKMKEFMVLMDKKYDLPGGISFVDAFAKAKDMDGVDFIVSKIEDQSDINMFFDVYQKASQQAKLDKISKYSKGVLKDYGDDVDKAIAGFHAKVNALGEEFIGVINEWVSLLTDNLHKKYKTLIQNHKHDTEYGDVITPKQAAGGLGESQKVKSYLSYLDDE